MVLLDIKKETSSPVSLLNIAPPEQKGKVLSFSALLKGKETTDDKIIQNGKLVLTLKDKKIPTELANLELDPKITTLMTPKELKVVIKEAKEFLKNKIVQSKGFTKAEIDALPKTLNGLVQVAKKIGIDVSKITLEEVKGLIQTNKKAVKFQETKAASENLKFVKKDTAKNNIEQIKHAQKQTLLFKAQSSASEITTQQIVDTKVNHLLSQKTPKQKSNDTLQLLLHGEKVSKKDISLTADFSVATAKVIAPHAIHKTEKSLESLLKKSTKKTDDVQVKTDGMHIAKADSFEVKLNEAKQMVKYLSHDVKSAIEDYKSPFTRVKVQLNPQRLGEIDLTVVQRGKNLHINLSSNNAAINTLAMNANDLKVQLNNNGINNASFNFNSNAQSNNSQAGQQQQQQRQADEEYSYFDLQEHKEESINSLEIIVPHYA